MLLLTFMRENILLDLISVLKLMCTLLIEQSPLLYCFLIGYRYYLTLIFIFRLEANMLAFSRTALSTLGKQATTPQRLIGCRMLSTSFIAIPTDKNVQLQNSSHSSLTPLRQSGLRRTSPFLQSSSMVLCQIRNYAKGKDKKGKGKQREVL